MAEVTKSTEGKGATTATLTVYATTWCGDCKRSKRLMDSRGTTYTYIDIDKDPAAAEIVRQINHGMQSVPTIIFPDGDVLVEPSDAKLAAKLDAIGA